MFVILLYHNVIPAKAEIPFMNAKLLFVTLLHRDSSSLGLDGNDGEKGNDRKKKV
jgi:hypothetical protein